MVQLQRLLEIIGQYNISAYIHLIGRNSMVDITEYIVHGGRESTQELIARANVVFENAQKTIANSGSKKQSMASISSSGISRPPSSGISRPPSSGISRPPSSGISRPLSSGISRPLSSGISRPVVLKPPVAVGGTHIAYINDPVIYMDRPSMGSRILKSIAIATAIVLIILILYHVFASEPLVSKLEQSGWVVYYLRGCKYCTKQRQVFDDHYDNYVEINSHGHQVEGINPPIPCNSALLTGFPLWYNVYSREIKLGVQDKESLNMMVL
jgi:hypothetical protein